jgi:nucleoside-diphosphate-sugar epimerase
LAAVLSSIGESSPTVAHQVNTDGTFYLLDAATKQAEQEKRLTRFVFPSSVAVYGIPDLDTKKYTGAVRETDFIDPQCMYGCTKLYSELVGSYISNHRSSPDTGLSFVALRFPTLIGPTLHDHIGTGDFASQMVHTSVTSSSYTCFTRPDTRIPFLAMPDAVKALLHGIYLFGPELSRNIYNLSGFSASAEDFADFLEKSHPYFHVTYTPDPQKQRILDSWPEDLDDLPARQDWQWQPDYDLKRTINNLILPAINK